MPQYTYTNLDFQLAVSPNCGHNKLQLKYPISHIVWKHDLVSPGLGPFSGLP